MWFGINHFIGWVWVAGGGCLGSPKMTCASDESGASNGSHSNANRHVRVKTRTRRISIQSVVISFVLRSTHLNLHDGSLFWSSFNSTIYPVPRSASSSSTRGPNEAAAAAAAG